MSKGEYIRQECSFVVRFKFPIKYFKDKYREYNGTNPKKKKDLEIWLSKLYIKSLFPEDPSEQKENV